MKPQRSPGYLPVLHYLIRDLLMFRRNEMSWRFAWAAAFDYWQFDRGIR